MQSISTKMQQFPYLQSRIHPLKDFANNKQTNVFLKREDELSCGISGSKKRKYTSIIKYLLKHNVKHVFIIGGTHSNNILSALQVLREHQFQITVMLLKANSDLMKGNFKLSRLFLEEENIIWVGRNDWPYVENFAQKLANEKKQRSFILTEGACVKEGIKGAKTLGLDILRNEQEHNIKFNHIFMDAGTGFSASCCIKSLLQKKHPTQFNIIKLAGNFETEIKKIIDINFENTSFYTPTNAKSFGSTNSTIKKFIFYMAREHGVLVDPIYSAKCLYEAQKIINNRNFTGNILIIHSGGVLSLPNFNI